MPSESHFEPCSQRYGLFLVCGCRQPIYTKFGASRGLFGAFPGHIMEQEGRKKLVDTGKSSRTWSVPTVSLRLAVLNVLQGFFGPKMAVFGPKLQFLKLRSATCDHNRPPPPPPYSVLVWNGTFWCSCCGQDQFCGGRARDMFWWGLMCLSCLAPSCCCIIPFPAATVEFLAQTLCECTSHP